ncbi:YdcF family protein [Atlantibacter hermannii]|uniref:YdcF family protein n=1 Tax=Atlantibacter hermannii TaxID=565 RepID=UPI0013771BAD|nr:YdcF family protein [Atlantibacter hermannii]NBC98620.1 YdcF family protein [Atlantibacter hermannii]
MSTRKTVGIFFFIILIGILIISCINASSIYHYSLRDETHTADCAIIAGAAVTGDHPSPVFQERLNHAVSLYRDGYIKTLIVTGGYSNNNALSDAAVARRYLLSQNVPDQAILVEDRSHVTRENLHYAKVIMTMNQLHNALIVSDPLHMKRIMLMAHDEGIEAWSSPTSTSRYRSFISRMHFLMRETFWYSVYLVYRAL